MHPKMATLNLTFSISPVIPMALQFTHAAIVQTIFNTASGLDHLGRMPRARRQRFSLDLAVVALSVRSVQSLLSLMSIALEIEHVWIREQGGIPL
jgi:hypothetical protein